MPAWSHATKSKALSKNNEEKIMSLFGRFAMLLLLSQGCAGDLKPGDKNDRLDEEDPFQTTTVDASGDDWAYFSFAQKEQILVENALESGDWDLGFLRFQIKINGGVSGKVGLKIALADKTYDELTHVKQVPAGATYVTDKMGTHPLNDPGLAFLTLEGGWYDYDFTTHIVTPKDRVYVIDTGRLFYKMQLLEYTGGDATRIKFRWDVLPGGL
jgi:hypothetical protein